jgi:hypothetical protein
VGAAALTILPLGFLTQVQPAMGATGREAGATSAVLPSGGATRGGAAQGNGGPKSPRSAGVPSPAKTLPLGWTKSADVVATVQGDGSGLHVLVADKASAYSYGSRQLAPDLAGFA